MIPVKLIFVMPSIKSGGGNRVFIELANALTNSFEDVSIIYTNNSTDISPYAALSKIKLAPVGKNAKTFYQKIFNVVLLIKRINHSLKHDKSTLIIISDPILCVFFTFLGIKNNNNMIRFIQADDYRIYDDLHILKNKAVLYSYKVLCKIGYKSFKKYIFNSIYTFEQFTNVSNKYPPCAIVHPGINTDIFNNNFIRREEELNICVIARKHPWKGFSDFIKAWQLLPVDLKNKIDKVTIVSHDDLLNNFNMPEIFEIVKPADDIEIARIMNESHIFVSTSWWEGFGLPPLEAMACGCAIISSDSKGILEYAVDKQNCLLYEAKNVEELCSKLSLLINDNILRNKLVSNGTENAKRFDWSNTAKQFTDYIINSYAIK